MMKKQRYRIQFSKTEQMRFTGHLDLILTWERVFRRADLPLAYSEGYSPRPLLNMAAPLPLGFTSTGEIGDFWLTEFISKKDLLNQLNGALPPGLKIHTAEEIPDIFGPKLPSLVISSIYLVNFQDPISTLQKKIDELLKTTTKIWERKGKSFDLRPLILKLEINEDHKINSQGLSMTLATLPGATGRPDDVLSALDITDEIIHICRKEIILKGEAR